ncbi:MAG: hypothetical protein C0502_05180 [Opitutus sp.]|nr:hypothetical protein [Opitutus sp.]
MATTPPRKSSRARPPRRPLPPTLSSARTASVRAPDFPTALRPRLHIPYIGLAVFALLVPQRSVFALLNIDGTRNQIYVFGNASYAYDSNIFAQNGGEGDSILGASLGVELKRRAGIISVNGRALFEYLRFSRLSQQNALNPTFYLEFNKTTGRTTGALTINAYRTSRADSAVNIRTQSWNFPLGLSIKYPVNDKLYVTSQTGYLRRTFSNSSGLLTYVDYSQAIDLFYVFTSKLDLVGGYRLRVGKTDLGTTTDHGFSFGATNGLLPKVNGTVRIGYQIRDIGATDETYSQFTTSASVTWNATRKLNMTGAVARDFTTTAVGGSVDTFSAVARGTYIFTRRYSVDAGIGYGRNKFVSGPPRQDDFFTWDVGGTIRWNEHFQVTGSYTYLLNWSTYALSDFERSGYSLNVSSRF